MSSYLTIEKRICEDIYLLMTCPELGLMSEDRCPNCGFRLYMNSLCDIWCPECDFREHLFKTRILKDK